MSPRLVGWTVRRNSPGDPEILSCDWHFGEPAKWLPFTADTLHRVATVRERPFGPAWLSTREYAEAAAVTVGGVLYRVEHDRALDLVTATPCELEIPVA